MSITFDNAMAVIAWKFPNVQGITLNLENGVAWADRFVEWPVATLGPIPDKATADAWAVEWAGRYANWPLSDIPAMSREIGVEKTAEALARLLIEKGVCTATELRAKLASVA